MRGRADGPEHPGRAGLFCFGRSVVPTVWRKQAAIDNGTSALHASLHGAASRDPRGGETPMMRPNPPQLAACPASGEMRSNWKQNTKRPKTNNQNNPARWSSRPPGFSRKASLGGGKRGKQQWLKKLQPGGRGTPGQIAIANSVCTTEGSQKAASNALRAIASARRNALTPSFETRQNAP